MKILLVEPSFPVPPKSKNHKDFLPIGLLKLGTMYQVKGNKIKLIRGNLSKKEILKTGKGYWNNPDEIKITSLFTYWKKYVEECVSHYDSLYPNAEITVGGIYASLMPEDCLNINGVDSVWEGVYHKAEKYTPAYDLIEQNPSPLNYQIIHTSRGCRRGCDFCGTWKIEPKFESKNTIKNYIIKKNIVFYDNNLLMNPKFENILDELIELKKQRKISWCESQSGFDGRVLSKRKNLAPKIKMAGFKDVRIAWDGRFKSDKKIKNQIKLLIQAGYNLKQLFVFMVYNWNIEFKEMEKKRIKCFKWGVQIADCRYRPLDQTYDNYNPRAFRKGQNEKDYHIHKEAGWTDKLVRQFRKNVRRQNICIRHGFSFYSKDLERKKLSKQKIKDIMKNVETIKTKEEKKIFLDKEGVNYWFPDKITYS